MYNLTYRSRPFWRAWTWPFQTRPSSAACVRIPHVWYVIAVSVNKSFLLGEPLPCNQRRQKLLSSPWFGTLKAYVMKGIIFRRSVFFTDTSNVISHRTVSCYYSLIAPRDVTSRCAMMNQIIFLVDFLVIDIDANAMSYYAHVLHPRFIILHNANQTTLV